MLRKLGSDPATSAQCAKVAPCPDCGALTPYQTNRKRCAACSQARRRETYRTAAATQRLKRGVAPVKGIEAKCDKCSVDIVRVNLKHRMCEVCAPEEARARARRRVNDKSRERGAPQIGERRNCRNCSVNFVLSQARSTYCTACMDLRRANKLPTQRVAIAKQKRLRHKTDAAYAINSRMRRALLSALRGAKAGRSWQTLVGYTVENLTRHLERQFVKGMGWHNRDRWQIDHITPLASFAFASAEDPEFRAAWALSNLRPLWSEANLEKRAQRLFLL